MTKRQPEAIVKRLRLPNGRSANRWQMVCRECAAAETVSLVPMVWKCRDCQTVFQFNAGQYGPDERHWRWPPWSR